MNIPKDCTKCGACCAVLEKWAEVDQSDKIPLELLQTGDVLPFAMKTIGDDNRCIALEGQINKDCKCTIYPNRPKVCRHVEPGSPICLYSLGWHKVNLW